jgi:hypothetical protein
MLVTAVQKTLLELNALLDQLSNDDYCKPFLNLSNATIGEHTRHILEMFQCLLDHYDNGIINYDNRLRNKAIETNITVAKQHIEKTITAIKVPNKQLCLRQSIFGEQQDIETNFNRELLYNLEHCIHHQAIIKVALVQLETIQISESFGVAPSTLEYRKQCVQ